MSDENEIELGDFEGGFFDEAGINVNEVPDDQFGFGNDFWPVRIIEVTKPKVTANADKIGMTITWAVEHSKYDGHFVSTKGMGVWVQIPVPLALRDRIPFDPKNNPKDQQVLSNLKMIYAALGFRADEMGKINGEKLMHKICMAKIKPRQNDQGFWQFNMFAHKQMGEGGGNGGSTSTPATSTPSGKSAEELLREELENS